MSKKIIEIRSQYKMFKCNYRIKISIMRQLVLYIHNITTHSQKTRQMHEYSTSGF